MNWLLKVKKGQKFMTKYQDYGNFLTTKHTSYACTIPERKKGVN